MKNKNQLTSNIMMVRPANFGFNFETAANNVFQNKTTTLTPQQISRFAQDEFDAFVRKLENVGIHVYVMQDTSILVKPDAIFPNNWISMHEDACIVEYPMFAKVRRLERDPDFINKLDKHFEILERIDLTAFEAQDIFLEGTGSMIFDHPNELVYGCISVRTDLELLKRIGKRLGYEVIDFTSVDGNNIPIYHTNVMMAVGDRFVVICLDTVIDKSEREKVSNTIKTSGKEIIEISLTQMGQFAGNMIQLVNDYGKSFLIMSDQAKKSLTAEQIMKIESFTTILSTPIYTIEKFGGGSARCMIAEIFLPKK